jgi:hypothetical protein
MGMPLSNTWNGELICVPKPRAGDHLVGRHLDNCLHEKVSFSVAMTSYLVPGHQSDDDGLTCRMYAFDVHCNSYFPLFILLYGESDPCTQPSNGVAQCHALSSMRHAFWRQWQDAVDPSHAYCTADLRL